MLDPQMSRLLQRLHRAGGELHFHDEDAAGRSSI
jgi:hypothetical protein